MIEAIGLIWTGEAPLADVRFWAGISLVGAGVVGLWQTLRPRVPIQAEQAAEAAADCAPPVAGATEQDDDTGTSDNPSSLRQDALAEIDETRKLIQLGGVDRAASEMLRIMWHWPWWAEQEGAVDLPVQHVNGSEAVLPYSGVVRRKRIAWQFAGRQFALILDEQEPAEEHRAGELSLLVDAELRLRLDMRRGEDPFACWVAAGVSLCRADGWVAVFMDCAGAVRSGERQTRQAFERVLFGEAGAAFGTPSAVSNATAADPRSGHGWMPQSESRRRARKAREPASLRQASLKAAPFGSYPGLAVTFAPPTSAAFRKAG